MVDNEAEPASGDLRRILVVDDDPQTRQDFLRIFESEAKTSRLAELEEKLFGNHVSGAGMPRYRVSYVEQGSDAVELASHAEKLGDPFGAAFVDVRMPPGMDGIETTRRLLRLSTFLHVVIVTAFSDYAWQDIHQTLGESDRFIILKKPFDALEVRQLASALTNKARLVREQSERVRILDEIIRDRTSKLEQANDQLRREARDREESQEALARTQRLHALGQLTAVIAHEINNPLACISANLDYLVAELEVAAKQDPALAERIRSSIDDAQEATTRIARIVSEVRLFTSPQDEPIEKVDLANVLEASIALFGKRLEHVDLVRRFGEVPPIAGMAHRLRQVFVNLLTNALASFEPDLRRQPQIQLSIMRVARNVVVEVRDNGKGIAPETLPRVFEPFFTTRRLGDGLGLGLAVSQGIVHAARGRIDLTSSPEGTIVRVTLPASTSAPAPRAVPAPEATTTRAPLRVLVVDDDKIVLRGVTRMLSRHQVVPSASAAEALEQLDAGEFDAILCDVMMPDMSGLAFLELLRTNAPTKARRVVFMTGGAFDAEGDERLVASGQRRMTKPFSSAELEDVLYDCATEATAGP